MLALLAAPALAAPQGGYTKEEHPELGITLQRPRDFEQIPTQPDEEWVVLHYVDKTAPPPRPELYVVWIDWVADPPPPKEAPPSPEPADGEGRTKAEPAPPSEPPINTLERFLERRTPWETKLGTPGKARDGYEATVFDLVPKKALKDARPKSQAWCYAFAQPKKRTIAFIGEAAPAQFEAQQKIWRYVAEHARFAEPEEADLTKLQQKYARSSLRGVDYRIAVRAKLVRGWKAEDTANYVVVYHTNDQPLVRRILRDIESLREEYIELFPPVGEITAVSTVRVCKDKAEYLAYGGMPGSAGYWNSSTEELVFYDTTVKERGKRATGEDDTFIVLYHEAFHQYIHYSAGELPPHSWFNEGHGDYFSGAIIKGGKYYGIGVNPWRVRRIQDAIAESKHLPWREIIRFEQPEYYRGDRIGLCYAQGWSMIYFLRKSPVALKHPVWSRILGVYFDELKAEYARQLAALGVSSSDDPRREQAGVAARKHAVDKAFDGVDIDAIESAWIDFVAKLEPPKR